MNLSERGKKLVEKLEDKKIEVEKVESRLLQSLSETETSQGILAVLNDSKFRIHKSPNFILIPIPSVTPATSAHCYEARMRRTCKRC